ncbi:hypothetical protein ACN47E_005815 [Coniothyrium glycines]
MAERRSVRASSRRKTPTPNPPAKPDLPQNARPSRSRALRSASRDLPDVAKAPKSSRRNMRPASASIVTDSRDIEEKTTRRTKRNAIKDAIRDLTVVEEVEVPIEPEEAPGTPPQTQSANDMPYRSPGAFSEMSGTTAISSFSMVEAEFLEAKYILKHMHKLCASANEFLEHLAPATATLHDDRYNIQELQKPDSDFAEDYRDFDAEVSVHLRHYKGEEQNYINIRALHRALFGQVVDNASQSGVNLVLYLANLLIFAKQTIPLDRESNSKVIWDALRQLDHSFPIQFLSAMNESGSTITGASALRTETFGLALELRTQLAILVLGRAIGEPDFDPDEVLAEVFYRTESSQAEDGSMVRGWNIAEFGRDDMPLPDDLQEKVEERIHSIKEYMPIDAGSLERDEIVDLDGLKESFPWEATILRLIGWVRARHAELRVGIDAAGGPAAIVRNVKQFVEEPQPVRSLLEDGPAAQISPRRKRTSFGRSRRRSSRKFDPNAPVDLRTIDALKARERAPVAESEDQLTQHDEQKQFSPVAVEQIAVKADPVLSDEEDGQIPAVEEQTVARDQDDAEPDEPFKEPDQSGPPQSSAALLRALHQRKPQKENRPVSRSVFDRQANAQRVEFGNGFDESQATPGPSNTQKGKQPVQTSPRKRPHAEVEREDSEDDAFETEDRGDRVQERRQRAPVTKKVRIETSSSGAPPSHQPPPPDANPDIVPTQQEHAQEESVSEGDAPEMTDEPPPSTYQRQKTLAQQNRIFKSSQRDRKAPSPWTPAEEEAFIAYMEDYPTQYSLIIKLDEAEDKPRLRNRSQVALKDKARTMAINMIKSGTGLMPGFEGIVKHDKKIGISLMEQGYDW